MVRRTRPGEHRHRLGDESLAKRAAGEGLADRGPRDGLRELPERERNQVEVRRLLEAPEHERVSGEADHVARVLEIAEAHRLRHGPHVGIVEASDPLLDRAEPVFAHVALPEGAVRVGRDPSLRRARERANDLGGGDALHAVFVARTIGRRKRWAPSGARSGAIRSPSTMPDSQQRYRVIEKIDAGGMAEVFRAEREGLEGFAKQVAIKRVLPHLSEKERFIRLFLDEARLSARLNHSNCVQVFDIGYGENSYFIVMEWVDGTSLKALVEHYRRQGQSIPAPIAVHIVLEVAKGLAYAHELRDAEGRELGIIHRDISPPNVLLSRYGEVKIVDFGLAKANSQLEKSEPGIIKGKFGYLSPEAALGQEIDARTDVFALGIMLWELLAGRRLFLGETDFQTVRLVQQAEVPSIQAINPTVPAELARIIERSLAKNPEDRIPTAYDFGQQLARSLFEMGVTVTDFDIASLVRNVLGQKEGPSTQVIDRLIKESLVEFVSLGRASGGAADLVQPPNRRQKLGAEPLLATYEMPAITGIPHIPEPLKSLPARALEEGNLAALEDDVPAPASSQAAYDRIAGPLEVPGVPRFSGNVGLASAQNSAAPVDASHKLRQALVGVLVVLAVGLLGYAVYDFMNH